MGNVVVTMKVMPESPEVNLDDLEKKVEEAIVAKKGKPYKKNREPIGFGITALKFSFILDEDEAEGGTEPIESAIKEVEGVGEAETTEVTKVVDVDF